MTSRDKERIATLKWWVAWLLARDAAMVGYQYGEAISRDPARFAELVSGKTGVGGVYDLWRRVRALITGRRFDPSHEAGTAAARAEDRR